MRDVVLDASVVLKWVSARNERHLEQARELRGRYEAGDLFVHVPRLLMTEAINVAGRHWRWPERELRAFASGLTGLGFELVDPSLCAIAGWTAAGLTAYDASYVAAAELLSIELVTDDEEILSVAPDLAVALADQAVSG